MRPLALTLLFGGCSATLDTPESAWSCEGTADQCDRAGFELARAAIVLPGFHPKGLRIVHVAGGDACIGLGCEGDQAGVTWNDGEIAVADPRAIVHEIAHAHRWRCLGDPDRDHADRDLWEAVGD